MYINQRISLFVLIIIILGACGQMPTQSSDVKNVSPVITPSMVSTSVATAEMLIPTATNIPPTATAEPKTGVDALSSFVSMPMTLQWSDQFASSTSGWEPYYEGPKVFVGAKAHNGYMNSAYEFLLRPDFDSAFLWDFNGTQTVPNYPYSILAEVESIRDSYAVVFADYQGDYGSIDASAGIAVVFSLKEVETTLGENFAIRNGNSFAVYEFRAGDTWILQCDTNGVWPEVRTAVVAMHVDEYRIGVELAPTATSNQRVTKTCARVQPAQRSGNAYIGMGAMHVDPFELYRKSEKARAENASVVHFKTIAIAQRTTELDWDGGNTQPLKMNENDCIAGDDRRRISNELRSYYGYDSRSCDPGAFSIDTYPLVIIPYDNNVDELIGSWQCGSDPENLITISQRGQFLQLANMYDTYGMVYVTNDYEPEKGKYFYINNEFSTMERENVKSTDNLTVGMRMINLNLFRGSFTQLILVYRDGQLKSNWAGDCINL